MTLEETAEFVRLYAKCFTYPRPVDVRVWTDVLLTGWYRRRGPAGIPRELAILAADSHPDFKLHPENFCGCTADEAWSRLSGNGKGGPLAARVLAAFMVRVIRESSEFGVVNSAFRGIGSLSALISTTDPEQRELRDACSGIYNEWRLMIDEAAEDEPAFLALRSSTARILPLMTLEPLIPKPERLRPSVHHEHYECFFHDLTAQVRSLYNQVFSRPIENPSVFTSYLFGYDHQLLTYSMGQSGKYGEDPRMIFERRKQGMIPPWKPFSPEQAETTAARISACMTWILGTAPPTIEEAESLARLLRGLSFK